MLLPMGPMNMELEEEPPSEIRTKQVHFWRGLVVLFVGLFVLQLLAIDIFGAVFTGIMTAIVWYMVSNRCLNMTQYCLFMFGLLCCIQAIFESITLLMMVGGRRISHTSSQQAVDTQGRNSITYTTTIEQHPFFDPSMGFKYNVQSAMRIASPAVMILAGFMAYWSYNTFQSGLFSYREEEPMLGGGGRLGNSYGYNAYGGPRNDLRSAGDGGGGGGRAVSGNRQPGNNAPRLFEGSGQRLGGK